MSPWLLLARRPAIARRTQDWQRTLGDSYRAWAAVLKRLPDPTGATFFTDFGSGEAQYEVVTDDDGYLAVGVNGGGIHRINATEAEFQSLECPALLRHVARASQCDGDIGELAPNLFRVGSRTVEGTTVVLYASLGSFDDVKDAVVARSLPRDHRALLLVPNPAELAAGQLEALRARAIAAVGLPAGEPWGVDWSPLIDALGVSVSDPGLLLGDRFRVVVDTLQQRVWIDSVEVVLKAGSQPYKFIAHLAERPNVYVPYEEMANRVLDAQGDRSEAKIYADVRGAFLNAVRAALATRGGAGGVEGLIESNGGRCRLAVNTNRVRVFRTPTEP